MLGLILAMRLIHNTTNYLKASILLKNIQTNLMKSYLIIFFIALGFSFLSAQDDQTVKNINQKKEITEQDYLDALAFFDAQEVQSPEKLTNAVTTAMTYLMYKQDNQGQIDFFEKAAQYALRLNQIPEYVDMKSNKAQMLISNNQAVEGIAIIDSLEANYEIEPGLRARFYKAKGDAYDDLRNLEKAEKSFLRGLELAEEIKDTFTMGICYISLASSHSTLGNVYDAIDYNIKGLNILEQGDNAYLVTGACEVLCNIFQDLGNYDKAQEYAEKMHQLCEMNGYKQIGAIANASMGKQALHRKEYDAALQYFDRAMVEYNRKAVRLHAGHSNRSAFNVKISIVRTYLAKGDYDKAEAMLSKIEKENLSSIFDAAKMNYYDVQIESAIHAKNNSKIRTYLSKAQDLITDDSPFKQKKRFAWLSKRVAEYFGNFKEANTHLNSYFSFKDSIEKDQKSQLIHNLEAKYQKAEQEKEISKLSYENEKAESQIKQKNIVLILGAIGLAILSILVFQFYKLYQSNKKNKEQLASQNNIVTKALEDKNTLLKEIHHRVKNNLQVISSLLSLQSRYIKDEDTLDAIKAGKSRVQSMSLLHQNLYRDDNLKGVEMNQYFQNLGQNLFDTYNIEENIKLTMDIDDITLDIDTVVPMGLITNELISNALKHAFKGRSSGNIHLSLKEIDDTLHLTVKDDGIGLPDAELPVSYKSLGATLIQSFAEKLGR